jgi:hypothetical protein
MRSMLDALAPGGLALAAADQSMRMVVYVLILWYTGRTIIFFAESELGN